MSGVDRRFAGVLASRQPSLRRLEEEEAVQVSSVSPVGILCRQARRDPVQTAEANDKNVVKGDEFRVVGSERFEMSK